MNDARTDHSGKDRLEFRKLELEIADAEFRHSQLREKEKLERDRVTLELRKLDQEVFEKKLTNDQKQALLALEEEKAGLEVKEKQLATAHAVPAAVWDFLKYLVAVVPIVATLIGLYLTYDKDTRALRRQAELDHKLHVDSQVVELIKKLSDPNQTDAVNAAVLLAAYGKGSARIIIPHIKLKHAPSVYPYLVQSLVDVVALESGAADRQEAAEEIVQRLTDQTDMIVKEYLAKPADETKREYVLVGLDAFVQLGTRCAPVCKVLLAALKSDEKRINNIASALLAPGAKVDKQVRDSATEVKNTLASAGKK